VKKEVAKRRNPKRRKIKTVIKYIKKLKRKLESQ
jgi:hypothetical protein